MNFNGPEWTEKMAKKEDSVELKSVSPGMAFGRWWRESGRLYDPDVQDVSWFDKRYHLAQEAFEAGMSCASKDRDDWRSLAEASEKAIDTATKQFSELATEIASLHKRLSEAQMINVGLRDEIEHLKLDLKTIYRNRNNVEMERDAANKIASEQRLQIDALKRALKSALKLPRPWMMGNGLTWPEWDGIMADIEKALEVEP